MGPDVFDNDVKYSWIMAYTHKSGCLPIAYKNYNSVLGLYNTNYVTLSRMIIKHEFKPDLRFVHNFQCEPWLFYKKKCSHDFYNVVSTQSVKYPDSSHNIKTSSALIAVPNLMHRLSDTVIRDSSFFV